jgi:hypothetical protein
LIFSSCFVCICASWSLWSSLTQLSNWASRWCS